MSAGGLPTERMTRTETLDWTASPYLSLALDTDMAGMVTGAGPALPVGLVSPGEVVVMENVTGPRAGVSLLQGATDGMGVERSAMLIVSKSGVWIELIEQASPDG